MVSARMIASWFRDVPGRAPEAGSRRFRSPPDAAFSARSISWNEMRCTENCESLHLSTALFSLVISAGRCNQRRGVRPSQMAAPFCNSTEETRKAGTRRHGCQISGPGMARRVGVGRKFSRRAQIPRDDFAGQDTGRHLFHRNRRYDGQDTSISFLNDSRLDPCLARNLGVRRGPRFCGIADARRHRALSVVQNRSSRLIGWCVLLLTGGSIALGLIRLRCAAADAYMTPAADRAALCRCSTLIVGSISISAVGIYPTASTNRIRISGRNTAILESGTAAVPRGGQCTTTPRCPLSQDL